MTPLQQLVNQIRHQRSPEDEITVTKSIVEDIVNVTVVSLTKELYGKYLYKVLGDLSFAMRLLMETYDNILASGALPPLSNGDRFPLTTPATKAPAIAVPKVIALDLFGTVFDLSGTPREEIKAYLDHIKKVVWSPLVLPESWKKIPAFPDSVDAIRRLRKVCTVVTLSNAPLPFQVDLLKNAGIDVDAIIPLEARQVYKPNLSAYDLIPSIMQIDTWSQVLMVTGNKTIGDYPKGDHEYARDAGYRGVLIRDPSSNLPTLSALADSLGA